MLDLCWMLELFNLWSFRLKARFSRLLMFWDLTFLGIKFITLRLFQFYFFDFALYVGKVVFELLVIIFSIYLFQIYKHDTLRDFIPINLYNQLRDHSNLLKVKLSLRLACTLIELDIIPNLNVLLLPNTLITNDNGLVIWSSVLILVTTETIDLFWLRVWKISTIVPWETDSYQM